MLIIILIKDEQALGAIPLEGCTSVERENKKENLFSVNTPYRVFQLKADTPEQMEQWINAVKKYILSEKDVFHFSAVNINNTSSISFISNVEKEGYLTKSGKNGRSYKKRWCVLKDNFIYYFKSEKDTNSGAPLGVIPLQDSKVETIETNEKSKYTILIHTRHRTYKLLSDNIQLLNEWKELILHCSDSNSKIDRRLTINNKLMKVFIIEYKQEKIMFRNVKSYEQNSFVEDPEAEKFIEKLLKNTKYYSPDSEISVWKKSLAQYNIFFFFFKKYLYLI